MSSVDEICRELAHTTPITFRAFKEFFTCVSVGVGEYKALDILQRLPRDALCSGFGYAVLQIVLASVRDAQRNSC